LRYFESAAGATGTSGTLSLNGNWSADGKLCATLTAVLSLRQWELKPVRGNPTKTRIGEFIRTAENLCKV
jgi:hypothetical protein